MSNWQKHLGVGLLFGADGIYCLTIQLGMAFLVKDLLNSLYTD